MTQSFDDETLMAFADGALGEPEFSQIASALETDPALAQRLEALVAGKDLARAVYRPLADQPVPLKLVRAIKAAERAAAPVAATRWRSLAAAAAVALIVAGPAGYLIGRLPAEAPGLAVGTALQPQLANLIATVPSGQDGTAGTQTLRPVSSFADASGELCREFELEAAGLAVGIACRRDAAWTVEFALSVPAAGDGYQPASGLDPLDAYLTAIGAGAPMSLEEEAVALAAR